MMRIISTTNVLAGGLLLVAIALVVQSVRLSRRTSELTATTEALLEREQLATLGRLLAGIAHELNTPLGAVCCSIGTRQKAVEMIDEAVTGLVDEAADPQAHLARVNKALKALHSTDPVLEQALERTGQLVRVLRLAGRGETEEPQPVDVNTLVNGTLLLLQHELRQGVDVKLELGELLPVPGWPGPMGQILVNLVLNARQALGDQGKITIKTAMVGDKVEIRVVDDGPGLPDGLCTDRLFEAGVTTKNVDEGTGLGLFITRKLTRRHQGTISASNGENGGAEFVVTLPTKRTDSGNPAA